MASSPEAPDASTVPGEASPDDDDAVQMELEARTVRVLIVDDQAPFRNVARTVVGLAKGFEVVGEAESGEEAVALAAALEPDLVLMDVNLPGINGIEATRRILAARPEARTFLLSTYAAADLPAGARECGAIAYINKEDLEPSMLRSLWDADGDPSWIAAG